MSALGPAADLLGPSGPFARLLGGYEDRPEQAKMAEAVEQALRDASILLCEAGTGTGKTLAYLLPALASGQRVVISTATKALMDQILEKDLPLLLKSLPADQEPPRVVLAKGLSNYVCRRRFSELRQDPLLLTRHRRALPVVEAWVRGSTRGDLSELSTLPEDDPIWGEINSSPETRIGSKCSFYEDCFVTRMRSELESAQLIITNHHLFFADLALRANLREVAPRAGVLPAYDAVIFDEAHRLEDVAAEFFGRRLSTAKLKSLWRQAERAFAAEGLNDPLFSRGDARAIGRELEAAQVALFDSLAQRQDRSEGRVQLSADLVLEIARGPAFARLDAALGELLAFSETHATTDALMILARRTEELRAEAQRVLSPASMEVVWFERRAQTSILGASNVSVGDSLRSVLFERTGAVVLTSATLTSVPLSNKRVRQVSDEDSQLSELERFEKLAEENEQRGAAAAVAEPQGPFSFVKQRLGLDQLAGVPVAELCLESPFDYAKRALLYVASDLPEPTERGFGVAAAARAAQLIALTGGGAFVLTTSRRSLEQLGEALRKGFGSAVLVQGEAPKNALIDRFRLHENAILVGTTTFWEGVDVPGPALRLVIIDKLPFPVPNDALVVARGMALSAVGRDPFMDYAVPAATIALKQGLGRLIRTQQDFGIAAVFDRRLVTKGYGKRILKRLPMAEHVVDLEEVRERYREWEAEAEAGGG